jgi:hypothetical protein
VERAHYLAEPDRALLWFLVQPAPALLKRHARQGTAHAALVAEILDLLSGNRSAPASTTSRPVEPAGTGVTGVAGPAASGQRQMGQGAAIRPGAKQPAIIELGGR